MTTHSVTPLSPALLCVAWLCTAVLSACSDGSDQGLTANNGTANNPPTTADTDSADPASADDPPSAVAVGLDADSDSPSSTMQRLRRTETAFADGRLLIIDNLYDSSGRISRQTLTLEGEPLAEHVLSYTANGQLASRREDDDANGIVDRTSSYDYNEAGQLVRRLTLTQANSNPDTLQTIFYNNAGLAIRSEIRNVTGEVPPVADTAGVVTETITHAYDRQRISQQSFAFSDDRSAVMRTFRYDEFGRLDEQQETTADGTSRAVTRFYYESGDCNPAWTHSANGWFCVSDAAAATAAIPE